MSADSRGRVVTFYAYKGGTGRSMALLNVACLLAKQVTRDKPVLVIDWDLDAPGLHHYLPEYRSGERRGVIELFQSLDRVLGEQATDRDAVNGDAAVSHLDLEEFVGETAIPNLFLLGSGRQDREYADQVRGFDWAGLFKRCPTIFPSLAEHLAERYAYVLIDSRTGVTDIGGVCTMLMPDSLVAVFTPNRQSVEGLIAMAGEAVKYRRSFEDSRPLIVFPLASRIENAEPVLYERWRRGDRSDGWRGYQQRFEELFRRVYELPECTLDEYFDNVQIQHVPRYSYGEEIAVRTETVKDRLSLTRSYEALCERLVLFQPPWEAPPDVVDELSETRELLDEARDGLRRQAELRLQDGAFGEAVDLLTELAEIDRAQLVGKSVSPSLVSTLTDLAKALLPLNRLKDALDVSAEALSLAQGLNEFSAVETTLKLRREILVASDDLQQAQGVALRRVELIRSHLAANSVKDPTECKKALLDALLELAVLEDQRNQERSFQEASRLAREADDQVAVAEISLLRGRIARQAGRLDDAMSWIGKALSIYKIYGTTDRGARHFDLLPPRQLELHEADALEEMAHLMKQGNRFTEAEGLFQSSLELREQSLGPAHPRVARALRDLGATYNALHRWADAKRILDRARGIQTRAFGPRHPEIATTLVHNAVAHRGTGDVETERQCLEQALRILDSTLGPGHSETGSVRKLLSDLR